MLAYRVSAYRGRSASLRTRVNEVVAAFALHAEDRDHTGYASGEQRHAEKSLCLGEFIPIKPLAARV